MTYYDSIPDSTVSGSYETLNDLKTANPDHFKYYLVTSTNKIYRWSTSYGTWVAYRVQDEENYLVNTSLAKMPQPHLSGLKLEEDIILGTSVNKLVLNSIDENGVVWICNDIGGWWGIPDVIVEDLPRGWGDGSYDAKGKYAARQISLVGSFYTQNPEQAIEARNKLIKACGLVYSGDYLIVKEPGQSKSAYVRLSGAPQIQNANARGRHNFSIGLKAPDPIKYEVVDETTLDPLDYTSGYILPGSTSTILNVGNIKVPLLFEIGPNPDGGSVSGLTASAGAPAKIKQKTAVSGEVLKTIPIVSNQSATDVLEIDTYSREVLFNSQGYEDGLGAARRRVSASTDWIELEPGENFIEFEANGDLVCTYLYRSGWIG